MNIIKAINSLDEPFEIYAYKTYALFAITKRQETDKRYDITHLKTSRTLHYTFRTMQDAGRLIKLLESDARTKKAFNLETNDAIKDELDRLFGSASQVGYFLDMCATDSIEAAREEYKELEL